MTGYRELFRFSLLPAAGEKAPAMMEIGNPSEF
jgi:hypothetical protein